MRSVRRPRNGRQNPAQRMGGDTRGALVVVQGDAAGEGSAAGEGGAAGAKGAAGARGAADEGGAAVEGNATAEGGGRAAPPAPIPRPFITRSQQGGRGNVEPCIPGLRGRGMGHNGSWIIRRRGRMHHAPRSGGSAATQGDSLATIARVKRGSTRAEGLTGIRVFNQALGSYRVAGSRQALGSCRVAGSRKAPDSRQALGAQQCGNGGHGSGGPCRPCRMGRG